MPPRSWLPVLCSSCPRHHPPDVWSHAHVNEAFGSRVETHRHPGVGRWLRRVLTLGQPSAPFHRTLPQTCSWGSLSRATLLAPAWPWASPSTWTQGELLVTRLGVGTHPRPRPVSPGLSVPDGLVRAAGRLAHAGLTQPALPLHATLARGAAALGQGGRSLVPAIRRKSCGYWTAANAKGRGYSHVSPRTCKAGMGGGCGKSAVRGGRAAQVPAAQDQTPRAGLSSG